VNSSVPVMPASFITFGSAWQSGWKEMTNEQVFTDSKQPNYDKPSNDAPSLYLASSSLSLSIY